MCMHDVWLVLCKNIFDANTAISKNVLNTSLNYYYFCFHSWTTVHSFLGEHRV